MALRSHHADGGSRERGRWRLAMLPLLLALAVIIPFLLFGEQIESWYASWQMRQHSSSLLVSAVLGGLLVVDIVAPIPSSIVSTACGALLGFWGGLLTSFVGMTISALLGLLLGRMFAPLAHRALNADELDILQRLQNRWGLWMLAAMRPVPVLAEASILFAGLTRLSLRRSLPLLLLGNVAVSAVYAACGAFAGSRHATWLAFIAAALLSGLAMLLARYTAVRTAVPPPCS